MKSQSVMHTFFKKYQRHLRKIALAASLISIGSSQLAVAATNPADPDKVLKWVFNVAETGFDPGAAKDLYSNGVNYVIFETLYSYDYLASPVKLIPAQRRACQRFLPTQKPTPSN